MERTNYYDGYAAGSTPMNNPAGAMVYAATAPAGYSSGYKVEQPRGPEHHQQAPYRLGHDIGSPTKRKAEQIIYPEQGMRLGTPATDDADGHYEYDVNTYGASRSRNEGGLGAGDYDTSDLNTIRVQNRSGKDVRMVLSNHSNMNIPLTQSAGSAGSSITSSNDYAPQTPGGGGGDASGYSYSVGDGHRGTASPPNGQKPAGSVVSNPASNTASSPTDSSRKKQKRNKPTLSCSECVERKTKCDRGRPHCLSCIKRQTECKYAHVANLLEYV